jgi:hypothetical protein
MSRKLHPRSLPALRFVSTAIKICRQFIPDLELPQPATVAIDPPRRLPPRETRVTLGPRVSCRRRLSQVA